MKEEKKLPWPLPTREEMEQIIADHLEEKRQWEIEIQRRYGKDRFKKPNKVAKG